MADPGERVRKALGELYAYYERTAYMLENVYRDAPVVPALVQGLPLDPGALSHGAEVEALANLWRDFLVTWDEFTNMPDKFLDAGEGRVLVLTRFGGRSKGGGIPITDFPGASLFTLREGKVVRLFLYPDQKEALEAAGLQE